MLLAAPIYARCVIGLRRNESVYLLATDQQQRHLQATGRLMTAEGLARAAAAAEC